jgi:putative NIF3 family GTP cyclohydrolase 1 type 2
MQMSDVLNFLRSFAPLDLAESWDNVGLLLGSEAQDVSKVITCLTLTQDVAAEAISRKANLVIAHHPVLFKAVQRVTDQTAEGRMLLDLIRTTALFTVSIDSLPSRSACEMLSRSGRSRS